MLCQNEGEEACEVVVKWRGGQEMSERALVCELMATLLAEDFDLPVPRPYFVEIEPNFVVAEGKPELAVIAEKSAGLNFGSERLPSGASTWPKDKPIPVLLRALAAEVFAFDVLIDNPDRRTGNPNLLWTNEEIFLYDHEQAFSFLMGVIGWQPPWTGGNTEFFRGHVFYQQLAGMRHSWDRLNGALGALTDARLTEYIEAVPVEWRSNNQACEKIADYLRDARQNRAGLFGVIDHILR
jgi:hypothetical protein